MFEPLPPQFSFPEAEKRILAFWEQHDIFGQSLQRRAGAPRFVFYEGPPTANGLPHPGHCLTRAIKDLFPRYQTMCGKLVERKAGWDTHGLPVEVEVCKELGIHTKAEIEQYGLEKFVRKCIESVFRYTKEWEQVTKRLGFWVNLDEAYVTYHQSYVESVWWGLRQLFERGLLYQGHKVVWWWAQGGTALSAGEVGEGYRTVQDPSVYVRFALRGDGVAATPTATALLKAIPTGKPAALLVWTTTPWTLISNHFAAVHPEIEYALVHDPAADECLVIAAALVDTIATKLKREYHVLGQCPGRALVGLRYLPPFDVYHRTLGDKTAALAGGGVDALGWRVTAADFVTLESGTGLVHEAPAYGEVDFELLQSERQRFTDPLNAIPLLNAVGPDGNFTDEAPPPYRGRWVKDCDKDIIRELRERGLLLHQETIEHEYPFCPRSPDDPLIQYARRSWFVRTSQFKEQFRANNAQMNWLPEHIRDGRFGDFLRNNVDWALSRERYWGTPLPIWVCEQTGRMEAVASLAELEAKPGATDATSEHPQGFWSAKLAEDPALPEHLRVHKPYIDAWTYDSPFATGARMRRVSEVIDCWWDAGSMPFAQWGFPHAPGSTETFAQRFPADFISEAIDQTRGWFYGLLAISTLLFGERDFPLPFRTCIVLGHMMGEDGNKMSKRLRNYREPNYIFDALGADAMRWYFFSAQVPWTSTRFVEASIRDAHREFLVRLYNVFSFFNIYANLDGFVAHPTDGSPWRPTAERGELDRWIISELYRTIAFVRAKLDAFENFPAAQRLNEFVDALSNWYVRRSRERFWKSAKDQDKWDAYHTLYGVLATLSRLIAPFTPFFAEVMYHNLVGLNPDDPETMKPAGSQIHPPSVHLCDYPDADATLIDETLAQEMDLVRDIVSLGRAARTTAKLKVRQPLALVEIMLARPEHADWLHTHSALIAEELNIKQVEFATAADHYVTYQIKPNFKSLGPRFGARGKQIAAALQQLDAAAARRALDTTGRLTVPVGGEVVQLHPEDVEIRLEAKPGWSAAQGRAGVVVVKTELTDALRDEGLCRELIHHVQALRKEQNLAYEARIHLFLEAPAALERIATAFRATLATECLADELVFGAPPAGIPATVIEVEGHAAKLAVVVPS